jgi:hypothetical protein
MLESSVLWLNQISAQVFWTCALLLVTIDVIAATVVLRTRSRALVNRWTSRVLAANLLLLGAGLGVPVAAQAAKLVASTLAPVLSPGATSSKSAQLEPAAVPSSEQIPAPPTSP